MDNMISKEVTFAAETPVLVTGAAGFIGAKVVESLLAHGLRNIRCLVRPSGNAAKLEKLQSDLEGKAHLEIVRGNLLSNEDCIAMTKDVAIVYHLAAGTGEKSYPDAFMNSVVTTRNLLEGCLRHRSLKRFVSISSFAVYSNRNKRVKNLLDETSPVEERPVVRGEAYCYAKLKQDELIIDYGKKHGIPYVLLRPGVVYGPGKIAISGRVGRDPFGIFLHFGGSNKIPFTYVDNCADAIVLAGIVEGVDGEVFNIVDDDLPSSRSFLRAYKKKAKRFRSVYVPHALSYLLCYLWEKYSAWSHGQLPPVFNRPTWHANWKSTLYSNQKLKSRLGWQQKVPTGEGMNRFFEACRQKEVHA